MDVITGLAVWIVSILVATIVGSHKGATASGFILGMFLGPLGVIIALVSKGNRIRCPYCREYIDPQAVVCPKCRYEMPLPPPQRAQARRRQAVVNEIRAESANVTYRVIADRHMDREELKRIVWEALQDGRLQEPHSGGTTTLDLLPTR